MIPQHVAIIMDGNGRWARARGFPRTFGHLEGVKRVKEIVNAANELGIKVLTIFTFSTENWNRPKHEINMLMKYLENYLKNNLGELKKNGIRLNVMGRRDRIPKRLLREIEEAVKSTRDNSRLILNLALDYGGRFEIINAVKSIVEEIKNDKSFDTGKINEAYFSGHLYTKSLPEPDLLIRTSGEQRISNFMLWQLSYSELYFTDKLWPDFKKNDLEEAIEIFSSRQRRFGRIK
ncbi:MAG: isoprenyl transferase [Candidatus Omnitrophota bacterium]|nr:isoprenyl transferase [Candidatus Omnitrophota bacterium]